MEKGKYRVPPVPGSEAFVEPSERDERLDQVEDWLFGQGWRGPKVVAEGSKRWECQRSTVQRYIADVRKRVKERNDEKREDRVKGLIAKREAWVRTLVSERNEVVPDADGVPQVVVVQPGPKEFKVAHDIQSYIDAMRGDRPDLVVQLRRSLTPETLANMTDAELEAALETAGRVIGKRG